MAPHRRWVQPQVWVPLVMILPLSLGLRVLVVHAKLAAEAARNCDCVSQLKQYGLALQNYHSAYGCFPPAFTTDEAGIPIHSWRVAYLRVWKEHDLHGKYDFRVPWNKGGNARLSSYDTPGFFFWCPSGDGRQTKMTDYVAVVGPHTAWPGSQCRSLSEITDGPENTILVIEVAGSKIHWMEPRDVSLDDLLSQGVSSHHPRYFNALFADGAVRRIRKHIDRETLKSLLTINGGETIDLRSLSK